MCMAYIYILVKGILAKQLGILPYRVSQQHDTVEDPQKNGELDIRYNMYNTYIYICTIY